MSEKHDILKNKNFFLLWLGQIISQFGDRLNQMALIALVYMRNPGSAFAMAKLLSFTIIPAFVVGPVAGAYVDRWDRKKTMIFCDLTRSLLVLFIPFVLIKLPYSAPLYITVFLIFSISCFFIPSKLSIIPDIVPQEKLLMANSLTTMSGLIAVVLGVGIGGPLVEAVGTKGGFMIDAFTYLISAAMIAGIVIKNVPAAVNKVTITEVIKIEQSIFIDVKEGLRYVITHQDMRFVLATLFILMSAAGALYVVFIIFIQETLGTVTKDLGVLAFFLGGGFSLGGIWYGRKGRTISKHLVMYGGLVCTGLLISLFAILINETSNIWNAGCLIFLIGCFTGPIVISANTLVHEVIAHNMRGRTFSSLGIVMNLGFLIFMFLASTFAEHISRSCILVSIGVILAVYGLVGMYILRLRNMSKTM
ncbi:MAG: MFS transporter [Candidatus Omnitrophota bacterium]